MTYYIQESISKKYRINLCSMLVIVSYTVTIKISDQIT